MMVLGALFSGHSLNGVLDHERIIAIRRVNEIQEQVSSCAIVS